MKQNNPMLEQREGNNEHPGGQENTSAFTQHGKILKLGKFQLEHWQIISLLLVIYDYCAVVGAYFLALWLRFDGIFSAIPQQYLSPYRSFVFLFALICIVIFAAFHMYRGTIGRRVSPAPSAKASFRSCSATLRCDDSHRRGDGTIDLNATKLLWLPALHNKDAHLYFELFQVS